MLLAHASSAQPLSRQGRSLWFGNVETLSQQCLPPVLAKHSKSFSLIDCVSVGVDRMQRNFEPMRKQVEAWQRSELTDVTAKMVIYEAFVEGKLEFPRHLARTCMICTSSLSTKSSGPEQSGVCLTLSLQHSRDWSRFLSSGRRRSWAGYWRIGSRSRSNEAWRCRPDRRSFFTPFAYINSAEADASANH